MKKIAVLFLTFFKIGAFTFGGGYAMIALLKNEFVAGKRWLKEDMFFDMVAIAESKNMSSRSEERRVGKECG